jgi:hypothetical protein
MKAVHIISNRTAGRCIAEKSLTKMTAAIAMTKVRVTTGIAMCTLSLAACGQAATAQSGKIHVKFVAASAGNVDLELQNGSPLPIQLRVMAMSSKKVELWSDDLAIECKSSAAEVTTEEPFSITHDTSQPRVISVPSAEKLVLIVNKPFPHHSDGAACKLKLRLASGQIVESGEFQP